MHVSFHLAHYHHPYYRQPPLHISPHYRIWLQILTPRQMISHVKSLTHVKPHHTTSFNTCTHIASCHLTAVHPFVPHTYHSTLITPHHIANATHHIASYLRTYFTLYLTTSNCITCVHPPDSDGRSECLFSSVLAYAGLSCIATALAPSPSL